MDAIDVLRENAGKNSVGALAKKLNRTHGSVTAKLKQIQVSRRISDGYTKEDLRVLLGVSAKTIRNWIAWGWMRIVAGRIPESSVAKFLRQHPDQYQLSRVEEAWFKGLIFPAFNQVPQIRAPRVLNSSVRPFPLLVDTHSAAFHRVPGMAPN